MMRNRIPTKTTGLSRWAVPLRPAVAYAVLIALAAQASVPAFADEAPTPVATVAALDLGGPTVSEFNAAFPNTSGRAVHKVDRATFSRYVSRNSSRGRLLTGSALAAAVAASGSPVIHVKSDSIRAENGLHTGDSPFSFKDSTPDPDTHYAALSGSMGEAEKRLKHRKLVRRYGAYKDSLRQDSLARDSALGSGSPSAGDSAQRPGSAAPASQTDTLILGAQPERRSVVDPTRFEEDRNTLQVDEDDEADQEHGNWFVNIFADVREGGGDGGGWDGDDWAAVIYVVVGVVVVGAFVIYGMQMLTEMALNQEGYPVFMEAGLRLSYSGKAIRDPHGVGELYRDAYLAGLRLAIGFDRPGMGIGLAAEGGYIDVFLRSTTDPTRTFDFKGGYLVAGPMIRFGDNDPWSFSLEFLNGTSNHASIGWISKSRMTLQAKVSEHILVGGHLGAVFYDLNFFDGLGLRQGNFNRDLSLVWGLDTGWEF